LKAAPKVLSFRLIFCHHLFGKEAIMGEANVNVTLPEGVSLQRLGRVLLDAWEASGHQWKDTPIQLP
jgi:hypothetical protein